MIASSLQWRFGTPEWKLEKQQDQPFYWPCGDETDIVFENVNHSPVD